jgi:hypothetical protein
MSANQCGEPSRMSWQNRLVWMVMVSFALTVTLGWVYQAVQRPFTAFSALLLFFALRDFEYTFGLGQLKHRHVFPTYTASKTPKLILFFSYYTPYYNFKKPNLIL